MSYLILKDCLGKDRGWKVNMITIEIWSKDIFDEAFASSATYSAVYAGLVANCKVKREEPDFTFEQVCDWVDTIKLKPEGDTVLSDIKKLFEESQYYIDLVKRLQEVVKPIDNKKKVVKKRVR